MKIARNFTLSIIITVLVSCNNDKSTKQIKSENVYVRQEIGWTMQIPDEWQILNQTTQGVYKQKGKEIINELKKENREYKGLIYLLGFKRNQLNIFQSNFEKIKYKDEQAWRENKKQQKISTAQMYAKEGVKIDTISSMEKIDGIDFSVFLVSVYNQLGSVRYTQKIYGSYISGFDFAVLLNYNNREDEETLHKFWKNSKFKK